MKKILATLVALSLPAVALADEHRGFYIQGDAGHASVKGKAYGESVTAKGFSPRLSGGYDFGDFRVAADYTHYKSHKESGRISSSPIMTRKPNSKALVFPPFTTSTCNPLLNLMSAHA